MAESTPRGAQDRLTFLLALVPYLIDVGRVGVAEAAARFEVPAERVRKAVRLIAVSGVPGETRQYQPGDLFDIDWDLFEDADEIVLTHHVAIDDAPRFSSREAAALIAGLQYLSALPENGDRAALASLAAKLTRGSTARPSQVAVAETASDSTLALLRDAIAAGLRVEFDYRNARGSTETRLVDPLRLESVDEDWYLRGWCHLRAAIRTFRLDRMSGLRRTDAPVSARSGEERLPDALFQGDVDDLLVDVSLAREALPAVLDYLAEGEEPTPEGDGAWLHARLRVAHFHGLKRLVASHAGALRVTGPPEARRTVAAWAEAALERSPGPGPRTDGDRGPADP